MFGSEARHVGPDLEVVPMAPEKLTHPGAGVAEQRFVDEFDGRGGALDVQEDRSDLPQLD